MDIVRPDQIVTLVLFMAALGLGWLWVKSQRGGLARRIAGDRRMRLVEVAALSPVDRAMILAVDGREFLILRCKGEAPVLRALPAVDAPATEDAA
ncbi:MAG: flagellar assembly protein FliO [Rhodobacter sp. CACIA14H1]|nr:MAG: flagellar assembly protein FliO [Rhodobacter sp. CACIA14H1]